MLELQKYCYKTEPLQIDSKIRNSDQTGFIKGRFIGENMRLVDGLINHNAAHNIPELQELLFLV